MASEEAGQALLAAGDDSKALGAAFQDTTGKVGRVLLAARSQAAGYQAIVRDIALAAEAAKPGSRTPDSEWLIGAKIDEAARETGVSRDGLAQAVGRMVSDGMGYQKALELAPLLAKFSVGQKADAGDSASLMAMLGEDFGVDTEKMPEVMARIASFGKAEKIDRAELVKVLPVLLRDLKNIGITGEAALVQAQAILKQRMVIDGDAHLAAKFLDESLRKLRGKGSEAELKKGRDAIRAYSGNQKDEYQENAGADIQALNSDHTARTETETSKWGNAGHAIERVGLKVGQAMQPVTNFAADKLAAIANGAADMAQQHPWLTAGATTVAAGYGLYRSGKAIGSALGLFGGKGKEGGDGIQKVEVTNWPGGGGMGGSGGISGSGGIGGIGGMPDLPGTNGRRPRSRWARIAGSARRAGSTLVEFAKRAWVGRAAITTGAKPLLRVGVPGLTALYTGGEMVAALSSGSAHQRTKVFAGAAAEGLVGAAGAFFGGPLGFAVGASLGRMASDYIVDKLAETPPVQPASRAPAAPITPVAPTAPVDRRPAAIAALATAVPLAVASVNGAAPPSAASPGLNALTRPPAYLERLYAYPAGLPGATLFAPAAVPARAVAPSPVHAPVAMAADKRVKDSAASVPTDAAKEGALQAAVNAAAAPPSPSASRSTGGAAAPQPAQINFRPSISITVQGDVREPRRIAEELMPHLRQLFDQFQGQQQRSSLFDAPLTAGGIAS